MESSSFARVAPERPPTAQGGAAAGTFASLEGSCLAAPSRCLILVDVGLIGGEAARFNTVAARGDPFLVECTACVFLRLGLLQLADWSIKV